MRFGIDARLASWPGVGRYVQEVLRWLPRVDPTHEYLAFCRPAELKYLQGLELDSQALKLVPFAPPLFSFREQFAWPSLLRRQRVDLFFSPHLVVPVLSRVPVVLTVHDLLPLALPQYASSFLSRAYFAIMIRLAARKARAIVSVSKFTRDQLQRLLGVSPSRVRVIPNGSSFSLAGRTQPQAASPRGAGQTGDGPFLLYVGTRKPWKNLGTLLEAFAILLRQNPGLKLVIAGKRARHKEVDLESLALRSGVNDHLVCLEPLSEADLRGLYLACAILVCPSTYEGFGLTPLEGMALGCAIVAARNPAHEEVLSDCALFCDPHDPAEMADKITTFLRDPALRADFARRGMQRAAGFSWETCARSLLQVFTGSLRQ